MSIPQIEIDKLMAAATTDYIVWDNDSGKSVKEITTEFLSGFSHNGFNNKYVKIIRDGSVWAFIVNVDNDKKFIKGDILKPASYAAPARNKARGNVYTGYSIQWTGPNYL